MKLRTYITLVAIILIAAATYLGIGVLPVNWVFVCTPLTILVMIDLHMVQKKEGKNERSISSSEKL